MLPFNFISAAMDLQPETLLSGDRLNQLMTSAMSSGMALGKSILIALAIFIVGRWVINVINKIFKKILEKRNVDPGVSSFLRSFVNIALLMLLIISVVGALGVETTSFAAILASAGLAIGMALSGNLQNFAGGLMILLFKPFHVGDLIEAQGVSGVVAEIQIFHTILTTFDNKVIYIPNGPLSSNILKNYSKLETRRVDFVFGVEYGSDYNRVRAVLQELIDADKRILKDPGSFIALNELASSSVNIVVRVWVKAPDFWDVNFDMNKNVYARFNAEGINFPFPQIQIHQS